MVSLGIAILDVVQGQAFAVDVAPERVEHQKPEVVHHDIRGIWPVRAAVTV